MHALATRIKTSIGIAKTAALIKLVVRMIHVTGITSKVIWLGRDQPETQERNYIISSWHSNAYFGIWILKNRDIGTLVSQSSDGELAARIIEHFGFQSIRGSSSKGGTQALREMVKYGKGPNPPAFVPEGPRGPYHQIQPGIIMAAKMLSIPIVPWDYSAINQFIFSKSWDHHKLPLPFTIIVSSFGEPFYVPSDLSGEDIPDYCKKLEKRMMEHEQKILEEIERLKQAGANHLWGKLRLMRNAAQRKPDYQKE